jgi:hypothetical protein
MMKGLLVDRRLSMPAVLPGVRRVIVAVNGCLSCQHELSLDRLLPHLAQVIVEAAGLDGGRMCIQARGRADHGICPQCGRRSARVHSTYQRRLKDAPIGGRPVVILLTSRRFFCGNPDCPATTFAEQLEGLTASRSPRRPAGATP